MENCRKSILLFLGVAFFVAFSVPVYAETVEEKKAAADYDETLPAVKESQPAEETLATVQASTETQPAKPVVPPVQVTSVEMSGAKTVPLPSSAMPHAPSPVLPGQTTAPVIRTTVPIAKPVVSSPIAAAPKAELPHPSPAVSKGASKEMPEDQVFAAPKPSGLVEVSGYKYPVFLFAPRDYKTDRTYAMIMIAPAESAKAEKQIEYLAGLAQRKSVFILAPYVLWPKEGDTPYKLDEWLLTVKRDMVERFPISKKRVYLVGKDLGAHYAAYMAIKYPKEFAAVALLGEAWDGPFSQLIQPRTDAADQVPFYIALKEGRDVKARNQVWFDKLQKDGYPLHLVDYKSDEELDDLEFKKDVFNWMEATAQSWEVAVAQGQQTWKGKFRKGVKDFFAL